MPAIECKTGIRSGSNNNEVIIDFSVLKDGKPIYKVLFDPVYAATPGAPIINGVVDSLNRLRDDIDWAVPLERLKPIVSKIPLVKDVVPVV